MILLPLLTACLAVWPFDGHLFHHGGNSGNGNSGSNSVGSGSGSVSGSNSGSGAVSGSESGSSSVGDSGSGSGSGSVSNHPHDTTIQSINSEFEKITAATSNVSTVLSTWNATVGVKVLSQLDTQLKPLPNILASLNKPIQRSSVDEVGLEQFYYMETNLTTLLKTFTANHDKYDDVGMATTFGNFITAMQIPLVESVSRVGKLSRKNCTKATAWKAATASLGTSLIDASKRYEVLNKKIQFPIIGECDKEKVKMFLNANNLLNDAECAQFIQNLDTTECEDLFENFVCDIDEIGPNDVEECLAEMENFDINLGFNRTDII